MGEVDGISGVGVKSVEIRRNTDCEGDLQAVLNAGYSDAHVVDILLAVALNTFTNYVNEVTQTEVDFPAVQPLGIDV